MTTTPTVQYDRSWRGMPDEELRHYLTTYRRRLALLDQDVPDEETRESTREFLAMLIADAVREDGYRQRAELAGVPRDHPRFDPGWIVDLKARLPLDDFFTYAFGAELGRSVSGQRRGPCPLCGRGTDCFVVYTLDPDDQHYKCFRCQSGGDAINAVRQKLGLGFVEALAFLAQHAGVPLPAGERKVVPFAAPRKHTATSGRMALPTRRG
jgi:hypothetical protein